MNFIEKQSIGISALFRKGLIVDFVLKSGVILSLILFIFLFRENLNMTAFNIAVILSTVILMIFQYKYFREIESVEDSSTGLREAIMKKIDYFNKKYVNAIYIAALSSPLLVISGMMYYFYLQYGRIRPL
ncbi:hypothetical protein GF337_17020, partial [candidate division KSB1 bacterium]|nr:hypothetical protein [candidate division KSB1 bacterium]